MSSPELSKVASFMYKMASPYFRSDQNRQRWHTSCTRWCCLISWPEPSKMAYFVYKMASPTSNRPTGLWKVMLAGIIYFWVLLCSFCFNFFSGWGGEGGGGCCGQVVFMGEHLDNLILWIYDKYTHPPPLCSLRPCMHFSCTIVLRATWTPHPLHFECCTLRLRLCFWQAEVGCFHVPFPRANTQKSCW